MRRFLIPFAALGGIALAALPLTAQPRGQQPREEQALRGGAAAVRQAAPMIDRSADSALELDIGPLLDALHPYGPRGRHMTLRELGRSNDPDFDRKLRRSIYRGSARAAATLDAMAGAAPSIRRSLRDMEAAIGTAIVEARRPIRPYLDPPPEAFEGPPPPEAYVPPPEEDEDDEGAPW